MSAEQRFCRDCGAPLSVPVTTELPEETVVLEPVSPPAFAPPTQAPTTSGPVGGLLVGSAVAVLAGCAGHFLWGLVVENLVWDNLYDHASLASLASGGLLVLLGLGVAGVGRLVAGAMGVESRVALGAGLVVGSLWGALGLSSVVSSLVYASEQYSFFEWSDLFAPVLLLPLVFGALRLAGAHLGWSLGGAVLLAGLLYAALATDLLSRWILGDDLGWLVIAGIPALAAGTAVLTTQVSLAGPDHGAPAPAEYAAAQPLPAAGQPQWTAAPSGTNGFAITSMVLGIVGVSFLSLIFGFVALSQLKRNPQQSGRGMAITGIVVSCCWIVAVIVGTIVLYNLAQDATYDYYGDY